MKIKLWWFLSPHTQVKASPITKITSKLEFLGKNLHLFDCATLCAKSKVMLVIYTIWMILVIVHQFFPSHSNSSVMINDFVFVRWNQTNKGMSSICDHFVTLQIFPLLFIWQKIRVRSCESSKFSRCTPILDWSE